jgi:hypothetical protein
VNESAALGPPPARRTVRDIPDSAWTRLGSRTIVFGDRALGADLLEGVRVWQAREPKVRLTLIPVPPGGRRSLGDAQAMRPTAAGGEAGAEQKTGDFVTYLTSPEGERTDLAFHMYSQVDFGPDCDPAAIFARYQARMEQLHRQRPRLLLAHITAPLSMRDPWLVRLFQRLAGRPTADQLNAKRAAFNALLRSAYGGRDPIFDLAGYQSTGPDGRRTWVMSGGRPTPYLAAAWAGPASRLNPAGQEAISEQFLAFLAGIP